jgi:hypothetical protein
MGSLACFSTKAKRDSGMFPAIRAFAESKASSIRCGLGLPMINADLPGNIYTPIHYAFGVANGADKQPCIMI